MKMYIKNAKDLTDGDLLCTTLEDDENLIDSGIEIPEEEDPAGNSILWENDDLAYAVLAFKRPFVLETLEAMDFVGGRTYRVFFGHALSLPDSEDPGEVYNDHPIDPETEEELKEPYFL